MCRPSVLYYPVSSVLVRLTSALTIAFFKEKCFLWGFGRNHRISQKCWTGISGEIFLIILAAVLASQGIAGFASSKEEGFQKIKIQKIEQLTYKEFIGFSSGNPRLFYDVPAKITVNSRKY